MIVINLRHASAARVTLLGLVCLLSVKSHLTCERQFVLKTLSGTQRATKIYGDLPKTTVFKSYAAIKYSDLPAVSFQRSARGYPTIVNNIRPCPKRCPLTPLTHVVARTESATREAWPISAHAPWHSTQQYGVYVCAEGFALHWFLLRALKLAIYFNSPKLVPVFKSDIKVCR